MDRVVCNIGYWAPGAVEELDVPDPHDPTGQTILPYIVQLDPPVDRVVSVPSDNDACVQPEVCFGRKADAGWLTLACARRQSLVKLRFGVGDRVACAVEDATAGVGIWVAGTIQALRVVMDEWEGEGAPVPYRIALDEGGLVLAHRDVHW